MADRQRPVAGAVLPQDELYGLAEAPPGLVEHARDSATEDRMRLRRGQEVAGPAGSRIGGAVVATCRVVQREVHEPGEGHRAVPPDLVADARHQRALLADRVQVGRLVAAKAGGHLHPGQLARRSSPAASGARSRAARPARPGCGRRGGSGSARPPPRWSAIAATGRRCRRRGAGPTRTCPRPRARPPRPRRADAPAGPACRSAPHPRVGRGGARATRVRRGRGVPPARMLRDVVRARSSAGRAPRSRTRVRDRVCRSSQATVAAEVRPATRTSLRESAAVPRIASSRLETGPRSIAPASRSRPRPSPPIRTTSSGPSMSIARRQRRRRSRTSYPATSSSQRGRALSPDRSGTSARPSAARAIAATSAENRLLTSARRSSDPAATTSA